VGVLARVFLLSKNVNYHLEHHLYPSVPFHRLPELHALLMKRDSYRRAAHVVPSYWHVLRECVGDRRALPLGGAGATPG
jgi:fatty acid desaturase